MMKKLLDFLKKRAYCFDHGHNMRFYMNMGTKSLWTCLHCGKKEWREYNKKSVR